jgi:hypothetical protein
LESERSFKSHFFKKMKELSQFLVLIFALSSQAKAYVLEGQSWNTPQVFFQMNLTPTVNRLSKPTGFPLIDGSTSWENSFVLAANAWNQYMARLQIVSPPR